MDDLYDVYHNQYRKPSERFKTERVTFYMLVVDDFNGAGSYIVDAMDWAFCENEWRFRQFMRFYDSIITQMKHHVDVFRSCNWEEFEERVFKKYGYKLNEDRYIMSDSLSLTDMPIYFNDEIVYDFDCVKGEIDVVEEEFIPDIMMMREFLKMPYFEDTEEIRAIREAVERACDCYILMYTFMITWYENSDDYGIEFWFTFLPDDFKIALTKFAEFPAPLEEMLPDQLIDQGYLLYVFLKNSIEEGTP